MKTCKELGNCPIPGKEPAKAPAPEKPVKVCQSYVDTVMYDFVRTKMDIAAFSRQSSVYRWGNRAISAANLFVGGRVGTSMGTALANDTGRVTLGRSLALYANGAPGSAAGLGYLAEGAWVAAEAAALSYGAYNAGILAVSAVRSIPGRCQ